MTEPMKHLNAPEIASDQQELLDVLWFLSEWAKAQCNSPALFGVDHVEVRARLDAVGGELQELQALISFSGLAGRSQEELLRQAIGELGEPVAQAMALRAALESRGLSATDAAALINSALRSGALVQTDRGGLRLGVNP